MPQFFDITTRYDCVPLDKTESPDLKEYRRVLRQYMKRVRYKSKIGAGIQKEKSEELQLRTRSPPIASETGEYSIIVHGDASCDNLE